MTDIEIEIDGKKLTAKPNQTVIQVADEAGIYIPRFCYHKHLSIATNCRMCLVEVEKSPKALPACATPVAPGMKVFTKSQKTIEAQRAVMEFLLINHPLDCPICDQGGECELQDLSMGYGSSHSQYDECKRSIADQNLGPLISTDMTRCIYCTRCVRFGAEVAGVREMGGTFRGEHTEIGTYIQHAVRSEVSGNIIDLCPVGALTSKPYRFTARAWELDQMPSISPHDCMGTNINIHTRYGKVMRVVGHENAAINETWIADRDRFSYAGLYHADRLEEPIAKIDGKWQIVSWQQAFELAASSLHEVIAEYGADKISALVSPSSTLEEFYLLQKIIRALGSPHIDHRLRDKDTQDQAAMAAFPDLGMPIAALQEADAILLIGSNIQREQPLASLRIRKAALKGAAILAINAVDCDFPFPLQAKQIVSPERIVATLTEIVKALENNAAQAMAQQLRGKQKVCVLLGAMAQQHHHASSIRYLAQKIAALTNGTLGFLTTGANTAGAWLAGAIPHRHAGGVAVNHHGLNAYEMFEKPRKAYLLLNVEPDLDCANPFHAAAALKHAKCVVALSMYRNPILEAYAHVILPMSSFAETSGTYVNVAGEWQSFKGAAKSYGASRPAWKILRVLGNFLHLDGFNYEDSEAVRQEVKALVERMPSITMQQLSEPEDFSKNFSSGEINQSTLTRIGEIPIYSVDGLVRRAMPLQEMQTIMEGDLTAVRLHPETARQLNLQEGDKVKIRQASGEVKSSVRLDTRIAEQAVWMAGGILASSTLGDLFGPVEIEKV